VASKPNYPTVRDLPDSFGQHILDSLLNLIYPEACFICSVPVARRRDCGICTRCWDKAIALKIQPPLCPSCGLPVPSFDRESSWLCGRCILNPPPFAGARSYGYYTAELAKLVRGLKFNGRRNLTGLLAPLLAEAFFAGWNRDDVDLIVPVPLHSKRRHERGFNQAGLLAHSLAHQIALPFNDRALIRIRPTLPQVGLTDSERMDNVRKAFRCEDLPQITGRRILLIDDVMTTGATAASAARTLMDKGALRVSVLTIARAVPGLQ
jgi:ComF family protein